MTPTATRHVSTSGHVATLLFHRPPHNFIDISLLQALADQIDALDADENCRVIVLASKGKSFCAGADFAAFGTGGQVIDSAAVYGQAMRLFRNRKPIVAAIQGAAIGAGLGLALAADFRIACPASRFSANFNRLGFHPGFGLSATLPRLVGLQQAAKLFYTGDRIDGARAVAIGLADELVANEEVLIRAQALAHEIAISAPDAVQTTRASLRLGLADEVQSLNQRELAFQLVQFQSKDFREGVAAATERRLPVFTGL
jgi:enoyl-CoA hydratase/carnithine racemase